MNVWIKRGFCLGLLFLVGCGGDALPSVPPIPKDYKPVYAPSTGVLKKPTGKKERATPASATES